MTPRIDRSKPAYIQIVETLRRQITEGELPDGAAVPSARELADSWEVSRPTAEKALSVLRAAGLVTTSPGKGTVVTTRGVGHSPADRHYRAQRTGRIYPPNQYARILAAELVAVPDHVAEALGIQPGSQVIRRLRVTYREDTPVSVSTSWFPGELAEDAPQLLQTERMQGGTAGYVGERTGRVAAHGRDMVAGQIAGREVAELLQVEPGSAVLAGRNWLYTESGDVVEYGEYFHPADRWSSYDYALT